MPIYVSVNQIRSYTCTKNLMQNLSNEPYYRENVILQTLLTILKKNINMSYYNAIIRPERNCVIILG